MFPRADRLLGREISSIEHNWKAIKNFKFHTKDLCFKPYTLMKFQMKQPLDEYAAELFDEEHIFRKIHMDHMLMRNFAHPIPDPSSAMLFKVK